MQFTSEFNFIVPNETKNQNSNCDIPVEMRYTGLQCTLQTAFSSHVWASDKTVWFGMVRST